MIVDSTGMRKIENASGLTVTELMERAGTVTAEALKEQISPKSRILFLAGKGNNGGDAFVAARLLKTGYQCRIILMCGKPATDAANENYSKLSRRMFASVRSFDKELEQADAVVDAVFGFGFHGSLPANLKPLFEKVNRTGKPVYSIDINSGAECDTDSYDKDAIRSDVTFALDCLKPFHMLRKEHHLFRSVRLLSLDIPHPVQSKIHDMNEDIFFENFPKKDEAAYKGSHGKILLVGGSYGMAGAVCLNILGASTMGAGYINCALPEEIYAIPAGRFMTPVYHPFHGGSWNDVIKPLAAGASAIGMGSGAVNMTHKRDIMDTILQNSKAPVVLDAEALRMLVHNTYVLKFVKAPVIITPHIGEFAALINKPVHYVKDHKVQLASEFAADYGVTVVLKGANTIVVSPGGEYYFNQSGNPALAQAGSGDLLTGIMTAMLSFTADTFKAVCMAVWIHGYLADTGLQHHSMQAFPFECYPQLMDDLFRKHGF